MTTQAQIDAARLAIVSYLHDCGHTFADDKGAAWGPSTIYPHLIAKAAITAAAEVGNWPSDELVNDLVASATEEDRLTKHNPAAAEVPAPHFWSGAEEVRLATIDRCARVADDESEAPGEMPPMFNLIPIDDAIRAAIRATKKSIANRIRAMKDKP